MTNRLKDETSPYLLQHAHNPVDWYPWGEEALQRAKAEDKPILLSVGYSACHWCHVMERESFEDEATAALMNDLFINIKVDREERPDVDSIYMAAVQAMTGRGGWPMTVFLTPQGEPFYGGTYYPPEPRYGMPSFSQLMTQIAEAYTERRDEVTESAAGMRDHLQRLMHIQVPQIILNGRMLVYAATKQMEQFDEQFGGYGHAPKFPQAMVLEMVLRHWRRTDDAAALHQVEHSLKSMANGGIYDQLGGGFARYSVDAYWLVPHFEKMLYDNALLARLYLETYQATHEPFYARIARETLDYLIRDMRSPEGGFYAAEDADSEGVEGKFYVWTPAQIQAALSETDAKLAMQYWDVSERGNWEGHSILNVNHDPETVAQEWGMLLTELEQRLERIRATLLEVRNQRIRPGLDDKILAAWNGMTLRAFALAGHVLEDHHYLEIAREHATFLIESMHVDGRLMRSFKNGQARLNGYLEDYANVADGLLELYQATFETRWLEGAIHLTDQMIEHFWDTEQRIFFDTANDHEELVTRPRDVYDNAVPSGTSVAVDVLLRLGLLLERLDYSQYAQTVLEDLSGAMAQMSGAFGRLLGVVDFALAEAREVAIIGPQNSEATHALHQACYCDYVPNKVLAGRAPDDQSATQLLPLLAERPLQNSAPTAYVCVRRTCQQPTNDPAEVRQQLQN